MTDKVLTIILVLAMVIMITGCGDSVTETPTDVASGENSLVSQVGSTESTTTEIKEEVKTETSSKTEIVTNLVTENSKAPVKDEKPATSTVQKPNKTNKPSNNVSSKPQNNTSSEDEFVVEEFDIEKVERLVAKYINEYRVKEGKPAATFLTGKTYDYVKIRAKQLTTNYDHDPKDEHKAAQQAKYGKLSTTEDSYFDFEKNEVVYTGEMITAYAPVGGEAIGRQSAEAVNLFTNDEHARRIAKSCYDSKGHWRYVGAESNIYISVGLAVGNGYLCDCVLVTQNNQYD